MTAPAPALGMAQRMGQARPGETIQFVVPGPPVGKGRARVAIRGGKVHGYTPAKTVNYEATVRMAFCAAYPGFTPIEGPVELTVRAFFQSPKSAKKKNTIPYIHAKRPDADNIAKSIADALNGVAWRDDSQVSDLMVHKRYTPPAIGPWVTVDIRSLAR